MALNNTIVGVPSTWSLQVCQTSNRSRHIDDNMRPRNSKQSKHHDPAQRNHSDKELHSHHRHLHHDSNEGHITTGKQLASTGKWLNYKTNITVSNLWAAEAGSDTMWPGPRSTSKPILILIHPTVWPQPTIHQRYRLPGQTERTDRHTTIP